MAGFYSADTRLAPVAFLVQAIANRAGLGGRLFTLLALRAIGVATNRSVLGVKRISQDCHLGEATKRLDAAFDNPITEEKSPLPASAALQSTAAL